MDKRLTIENASATGDDGLSIFYLWTLESFRMEDVISGPNWDLSPFKCQACDKPCNTVIRYSNAKTTGIGPRLRAYLRSPNFTLEKSILRHPNEVLGVDCGCYGRFQRQIAHIRAKVASS